MPCGLHGFALRANLDDALVFSFSFFPISYDFIFCNQITKHFTYFPVAKRWNSQSFEFIVTIIRWLIHGCHFGWEFSDDGIRFLMLYLTCSLAGGRAIHYSCLPIFKFWIQMKGWMLRYLWILCHLNFKAVPQVLCVVGNSVVFGQWTMQRSFKI